MKRLTDEMVFSGLVTAWFLAALPTTRSPSLRKPSTEGVVRSPSALTRISGSLPSMTAIAELVVPKSMPMIFAIIASSHSEFAAFVMVSYVYCLVLYSLYMQRLAYANPSDE